LEERQIQLDFGPYYQHVKNNTAIFPNTVAWFSYNAKGLWNNWVNEIEFDKCEIHATAQVERFERWYTNKFNVQEIDLKEHYFAITFYFAPIKRMIIYTFVAYIAIWLWRLGVKLDRTMSRWAYTYRLYSDNSFHARWRRYCENPIPKVMKYDQVE
jgi:hypothetical protein